MTSKDLSKMSNRDFVILVYRVKAEIQLRGMQEDG